MIIVLQHGFMLQVPISVSSDALSSPGPATIPFHFTTPLNPAVQSANTPTLQSQQRRELPHMNTSELPVPHTTWRTNTTSVKATTQNSSRLVSAAPFVNYTSTSTTKLIVKQKNVSRTPEFSKTMNSSYLLALSFGEQLSAASRSMLQLAPLAVDWNAQLVEPVVLRSQLYGIDGLFPAGFQNTGQASIKLSELYDMSKLNNILHSLVSPRVSMVLFKEFISAAPRAVTLLYFNRFYESEFSLDKSETGLVTNVFQRRKHKLIDCSPVESAINLVDDIENHLNGALAFGGNLSSRFSVEKVLCLDPRFTYRSHLLLQHITLPGTIVFAVWQGCGANTGNCSINYKQNSEIVENPDMFRYTIFTKATLAKFSLRRMHTLHNPGLQRIAENYLETVGIKKPFLSIHIRTERLLKDGDDMGYPFYYKCCLDHLKMLIDRLKKKYNFQQTVLITDTGSKYGTTGCGENRLRCSESDIQGVASALKLLNFVSTCYDPKLSNGTENSAYVSLVEMNMLSMGDKLILVGRGGFQAILEDKFLSLNHTEEDVYHICRSTKPNHDACHTARNHL